jgi:hypothetical protein
MRTKVRPKIRIKKIPYKIIFINTLLIWKMYKNIRLKKKENLKDIKSAQPRCQNLSISTTTIDTKLVMVMGNVLKRVEIGK